jgi:hypothetical protein
MEFNEDFIFAFHQTLKPFFFDNFKHFEALFSKDYSEFCKEL